MMRVVWICACLLLCGSSVLGAASQCVYPPCPAQERQTLEQKPSSAVVENECPCSETKRQLAEVNRNLSALWYTVSEFREVVARHIHHLHQHQVQMFVHQTGGSSSDPHNLTEAHHHHHHSHRSHSHGRGRQGHRDHGGHEHRGGGGFGGEDPFRGLDVAQPPKAFSRPPTVRNPEDHDFAVCHMKPNTALPNSNVHGFVYFSQKKNSETVYINVMLAGFESPSADRQQSPSSGFGHQEQRSGKEVPSFSLHGLHVHDTPDLSNGCDSAGPHYNPFKMLHGGPDAAVRHIGDFGNVASDEEGAINELLTDEKASLRGKYTIIGRPFVIHALEDDLGSHPLDPGSTSTGNSGARLACCMIEKMTMEIPAWRKSEVHGGVHELENLEEQFIQKVQKEQQRHL